MEIIPYIQKHPYVPRWQIKSSKLFVTRNAISQLKAVATPAPKPKIQ
jgi:hypothetical protein